MFRSLFHLLVSDLCVQNRLAFRAFSFLSLCQARFALEWFELAIDWGLAAVKPIVPKDDPDLHILVEPACV